MPTPCGSSPNASGTPHRCELEDLPTLLRTLEPELAITADTAKWQWRGETMDYSQAIEAMQFLEHKAASPETLSNAS